MALLKKVEIFPKWLFLKLLKGVEKYPRKTGVQLSAGWIGSFFSVSIVYYCLASVLRPFFLDFRALFRGKSLLFGEVVESIPNLFILKFTSIEELGLVGAPRLNAPGGLSPAIPTVTDYIHRLSVPSTLSAAGSPNYTAKERSQGGRCQTQLTLAVFLESKKLSSSGSRSTHHC